MFRAAGGFAEPVRLALARDPALAAEIARRILNAHFPESIRQDGMHSRASSHTVAASAGTTCAWARLALCSLHHKIFDLGAFTVLPGNHQIVFSRHLMGGDDTKAKLLVRHGAGPDGAAGQGMPAASGVSSLAQSGSVQGTGAGVALAGAGFPERLTRLN
jgi:hypothetical protein